MHGAPPPGYTPYNTSPYTAYTKRIGGLAKALRILVIVVLVGNVATLLITLGERGKLADFLDGTVSESDAKSALAAIGGVGALTSLAQLATAVVTIIWMFRVAQNHRTLGRPGSTWAPGWAIGGWFCPPVLFVIPWLMFCELWKGSTPNTIPNDPNWKRSPVSPIVHVWWVAYGLGGIAIAVAQLRSTGVGANVTDAADFYRNSTGWIAASAVVTVVSGVSFLLLISGLTNRQRALTGES